MHRAELPVVLVGDLHRVTAKAMDLLRWRLRLLKSHAWHRRCSVPDNWELALAIVCHYGLIQPPGYLVYVISPGGLGIARPTKSPVPAEN